MSKSIRKPRVILGRERLRRVWNDMLYRCYNPKNKYYYVYGGRGIIVCDRWRVFENFMEDMGDRPDKSYSLDRIDSNGNYCKENCRWATWEQQSRNRSDTVLLTWEGETLCLADWAKKLSIDQRVMARRLEKYGVCAYIFRHKERITDHTKYTTWENETLSLSGWAKKLNISSATMSVRYSRWGLCNKTFQPKLMNPRHKLPLK